MTEYVLPELKLRLRCAGAAHLRADHGAAPQQAPRGLRRRRQRRAGAARRGPREGRLRQHQPPFQGPRLPHGRAHQPLHLLEQPLAGRRRQAGGRAGRGHRRRFGSFDAFRAQFTAAALGLQGSGWGFLAFEPIGGNLVIEQLYDQQGNVALGTTPLLMLDMWEHAFYLDYVNVKADYVKAFWNIVNWADVAKRFEAARANATGLITLYGVTGTYTRL